MSAVSTPPPVLDFALRFVDGRGLLGLRQPRKLALVGVEQLDLEIPNLRFPFDVSGGAGRFQTRRCLVQSAELRLDEAQLQAWLQARPQLMRYGLSAVRARIADGRVQLAARARVAEREATVTMKVWLGRVPDDPQRLVALVDEVRAYGVLAAPAPLIALGLGLALSSGDARPALVMQGIDRADLNPLELVLWHALPPAGWRLPSYRRAPLADLRVESSQIVLRYGGDAAPPDEQLAARLALHKRTVDADRLLAAGDVMGGLVAYERLDEGAPPEVSERRLAILASLPTRIDEARRLAMRLIERHPERLAPRVTLAALEAERGSPEAPARWAEVVERAERAGEPFDALAAALAAGEACAQAGGQHAAGATRWLERVVSERAAGDERAAVLLAVRYAAEGRWQDLLQLEKRRLTLARGAKQEAAARARLGRLWLEQLGDPARARDDLERALRLDDSDARVWRMYARAIEATGDLTQAIDALGRAAARSPDLAEQVEAHLQAATLAERAGSLDAALEHTREALTRTPSHPAALARAASLLVRLGRHEDAVATYTRAVDATDDDVVRARLLYELAWLARDTLHDAAAARGYIDRSLALHEAPEALRLAAGLAEADGRTTDLEQFYRRLAEGGDRQARLAQARVLVQLGRWSEAAEAGEAVAAAYPREALPLVITARKELGQNELLRAALDRFVAVSADVEARVRLGRLAADDGDLERARELLADALEGTAKLSREAEHEALEVLCDVLLRLGDDAALERALGRLAAGRDDGPARARALSVQGAARARLGLTAEAAESYRAALALEPGDAQALAGLAECAYALRRWDEARSALEPLHRRALPPRVDRALRLGELSERLGQAADAIAYYQAALEAGASGVDAARSYNALIALYHARGDHDAEARAHLAAADDQRLNEPEVVRAGRLVAAADLLRKRLGRTADARAQYDRALAIDPLHLAALDALEGLAEAEGDVAAQANVLSRKVAATAKRPPQQKAILGRLAKLQAEKLGRPDAAREAYARALAIDPDFRPALAFLAVEARGRGDRLEELGTLERLLDLPADPIEPDSRLADLLRLAQLHFESGRNIDAELSVRRALEAQPRHARGLALLDEILVRAGRTAELSPVLALRAEVETEFAVVVDLLFRRASLLDAHAKRPEAIAAYEQLTQLAPSSAAAWSRLAALLREEGALAPLCEALVRLAERHVADGRRGEAEALFVEAAHLAHDRLHEPARAQTILARAVEVDPRSRVALSGLLTLARARGDTALEDGLLGRLAELDADPASRALAITERARTRRDRGDLAGATQLLDDLDLDSSPDAALKLLVEIAETRGVLGEARPALEALRARGHAANDLTVERHAVRRLARLAADKGPSRAAEELFRRALELDPDDRESARALADIEKARGDDLAYLETLESLLRTARRTFEGAAREAQLSMEMAGVLRRIGDLDGALVRLREALEAAPDDGAAWRRYGAVLLDSGAHPEAARALRRAAELNALEPLGFVELAQIHEVLGDAGLAADAYAKAGDAAPAAARAEALERVGKDDEALAIWRTLEGKEARRRVALIARRRAARAQAAGRTVEARAAALEALAGDPEDSEALGWVVQGASPAQALIDLQGVAAQLSPKDGASLLRWAAERFDGDEARVALERAVALAADAPTLVALGAQERGESAALHFRQALALDAGCADAAFGLVREGDPNEAARALHQVHSHTDDRRLRAQLSAALGALLRDRLHDGARARDAYRRAADESAAGEPWRAEVLRSLSTLELSFGDALAAEETLARLRAEGGARDTDVRHLAELYVERGAPELALPLLRSVEGSVDLLLRALESAAFHPELAERLEIEASRRMPGDARPLLVKAAAVQAGPLESPGRAAELLERAVALGPADGEIFARLGALYAGPLADPDRGAEAWARAWAADRRTDVLLPLADYHQARAEYAPARDYYEQALARSVVSPSQLGRVYLRLAEAARRAADGNAEESYLQKAAAAGAEATAWPVLAELYRGRGDNGRLAGALKQIAAGTTGAARARALREAVTLLPPEEAAPLDEQLLDTDLTDREAQQRVLARLRAAPQRLVAWVERLRAARVPLALDPETERALLAAERRWPELLSQLDSAAQADPERRRSYALEAVAVLEQLNRPGDGARRLARILDENPGDRALLTRTRRLYAAAGEPIYALAILDRELPLAPADDVATLKIARGELLLEAGADAEAEAEFLHALITTPRVGRAHAALAEVYKKRGDLAGALEHLIAAADAPDLEPARAAVCAVDAADVLLAEGDAASADRLYQLAAALDPADRRSVDGLVRLAAARGDHERHADLLGRAAALTSDRRERARLAHQRARLYQTELKRELDAYRAYKEAVACDPSLREAVRGLREMAETRGEWALVAELYYRELPVATSDGERARLHVELGRVLEDKLLEPEEALRNYEQAADLARDAPGIDAPSAELLRLYANEQRFADAAQAAERLAASLSGPGRAAQRAEALVRAGELYERAGDSDHARARLAEAAAIGGEAGKRADESLLRLTAQAGDLEELRRRIEERLAIEPEGELRLELLQRLVDLADQAGDLPELDARAQEVLARAPDDLAAFLARKKGLESKRDDAGVVALLRARAAAVSDSTERAARRFEAGRLAETRLYDVSAAAADYEAALVADPEHVAALDALADLAYRTRHISRARALYTQLADRPSSLGKDELFRRRAELAEAGGEVDEAGALYTNAIAVNPSDLAAHEALARLALGRGDDASAFASLRTVLDLLPLDAVDRITDLRLQLGELAARLGHKALARQYFELVLAQDPARRDALEALVAMWIDSAEWEPAADGYARLSYLTEDPRARAELLYRRGEVLRKGLGDLDRANDAYLKAADLHPAHAPTLRRLVSYYYHEGDFGSLTEVARDLEAIGAPLEEAAVHAGLGIALGGDEARGTVVVAVAQPVAERLAGTLAAARVHTPAGLDPALRVAMRALGGGEAGRTALVDALSVQLAECPDDLGARLALGRLYDLAGEPRRARLHYSVVVFVDPAHTAADRLRELGMPEPLAVSEQERVEPAAEGTLRDALTALAPLVLGLPAAHIEADSAPAWTDRLRPIATALGVQRFEAAVVAQLGEPAWAEPTRPPRLLLARRVLADEAAARFAAARALHALLAGVPLVEGRAAEDVGALLRAAASLFLPDLKASMRAGSAFVNAWQAELEALPVRPDALPEPQREHLEVVLAACVVDSAAVAGVTAYVEAERRTADRVALVITGDLRAGLAALCPVEAVTVEGRRAALVDSAALAALLAFAARHA